MTRMIKTSRMLWNQWQWCFNQFIGWLKIMTAKRPKACGSMADPAWLLHMQNVSILFGSDFQIPPQCGLGWMIKTIGHGKVSRGHELLFWHLNLWDFSPATLLNVERALPEQPGPALRRWRSRWPRWIHTVDGQIHQPPGVSCINSPGAPEISMLLSYISMLILWFLSYFVHSWPCFEHTNNIDILGGGGSRCL
jgi:hypothetical protein